MLPPTELGYDEILMFMLKHNGRVTNHELVKHFKVFLMNPDMRGKFLCFFFSHITVFLISTLLMT